MIKLVTLTLVLASTANISPNAGHDRSKINEPGIRLPKTLLIEGVISPRTANEITDIIIKNPQIKEVILNSGGGDEIAAITIGRMLRLHEISATVNGKCLSACFQYVFLQASKKTIAQNSIVAFHSNSISSNNWIRNSGVDLNINSTVRGYYLKSKIVEDYIVQQNLRKDILSAMEIGFWSLGPKCFKAQKKQNNFSYGILFEYSAAVPDLEMLNKLEITIKGPWPKNRIEIMSKYGHYFNNMNYVAMIKMDPAIKIEAKSC